MKKLLLLVFCCCTLSFCCYSQDDDCESLFKSATELREKGDYVNALNRFRLVRNNCGEYKGVSRIIKELEDLCNNNSPGNPLDNQGDVFAIDRRNISFGPQGGEEVVRVTTNTSWSFGRAPEWLRLSKRNNQLILLCESNASGEDRSAEIVVGGSASGYKKILVTQSKSILSVNKTSINLSEFGGASYMLEVSSNDDWDVVAQDSSWLNLTRTENGVLVSCAENPFAVERREVFRIVTTNGESVSINVTQNKSKPRLEMDTSIIVRWNEESRFVEINTNDPNWTVRLIGGSWCMPKKQNDHILMLNLDNNETGYTRTATIKVTANNQEKDITVIQRSLGYGALFEDYFINKGGTKRTTNISASVYGLGSYGLRVSAFMTRWKVVELDLLNLNTSLSKTFQLSWEPMVRGYLPLQADGYCWTAYVGVGRCVSLVDAPLKEGIKTEHTKVLLEAGAEFKPRLKSFDNISSRVFIRIDGYFSIGIAFDMYEWE